MRMSQGRLAVPQGLAEINNIRNAIFFTDHPDGTLWKNERSLYPDTGPRRKVAGGISEPVTG